MLSFRRRFCRPAVAIFVLMTLWPNLVLGQDKAGVVTTLEGNVTAARATVAQPVTLKFKDDVYMKDRITTGDRSLARMLLGGKAVVTVRERSVITITETTNKSTIDLLSGKIGLAVAKERMRPGEQIEVKTPNAVAAVRGTVIVAEVERATAQVGGPGPAAVTHFWVLRGAIECHQLAPRTGTPAGGSFLVNTLQGFTAAGNAPPTVGNITPGQLSQITGGLTPSGLKQGQATTDKIVKDQGSTAAWLSDSIISSLAQQSNIILPPITPPTTQSTSTPPPTGPAIVTIQPPPGLPPGLPGLTINQLPDGGSLLFVPAVGISGTPQQLSPITADITLSADQTLHPELATFSSALLDQFLALSISGSLINAPSSAILSVAGSLESTVPAGLLATQTTTVHAQTVADISGTLKLSGPLLTDLNGIYDIGGNFLTVTGTLNQTGTPPATAPGVLVFQGSQVTVDGNLASIPGNATINGPLVVGVNATLNVGGAVLTVDGTLTANSPFGLLSFDPTTVTAATVANIAGTLNLAGPLLTDFGGTFNISGDFLTVSGTLNQTGTPPATAPGVLVFQGSQVTVGGNLASITGNATLNGPLVVTESLNGTNTSLQLGGAVLALSGTLTANSPFGLLSVDPTTVSATNIADIGGTLTLAGPLLIDTGGTYHLAGDAVAVSGTVQAPPGSGAALPALLVLNGTTVQAQPGTAGFNLVSVAPTGNVTVDGLLVAGTNATLQLGTGVMLALGGTLTSSSAAGLLFLDPTTISAAGIANIAGTLNLAGPLLTDLGGTYSVSGDFLTVSGTLQPTTPGAASAGLVFLGSQVSIVGTLVKIAGQSTLNGLLLAAVANGETPANFQVGGALLDVGGTLTSHAGTGVLYLDGATVTAATVANIAGTLSLVGPLLTDTGGIYHMAGDFVGVSGKIHGPPDAAALPALLVLNGTTIQPHAGVTGVNLVNIAPTGNVTVDGLLVAGTNATLQLGTGAVLTVGGTLTGNSTFGLLAFDPTTVTAATVANIAGTLNLAGPLLTDFGGTFNIAGDVLKVAGTGTVSPIEGSSPFQLLAFNASTVNAATLANIAGTLNLAGSLLTDVLGTYNVASDFVNVTGTLNQTGTPPATAPGVLEFQGSHVSAGGNLASIGGNATLNGPLVVTGSLNGTNTSLQLGGAVLALSGTLTANSPFGLLSVDPTTVSATNIADIGGTLTLAGPLLIDTGGTYHLAGDAVAVSGTVQAPPGSGAALPALLVLNGTTVQAQPGTAGFNLVSVAPTGNVTVDGLLVAGTNATLQLGTGTVVTVSGVLTGTSPFGLLGFDPTTVTAASVAQVGGTLNLTGALLSDFGGTLNISKDFAAVTGTLHQSAAPTGSALFVFDGSTVNSGTNGANTDFFRVNGGSVTLTAPLLHASASALTQQGHALIEVTGNGHLTGNSTNALVDLSGGSLTLSPGVYGASIQNGTVTLAGGFFKASGTALSTTTGVPFVQLSNGSLTTGVGPVLELVGGTLNLGTQPLISSNSASTLVVGVGGGVKLTSSATLIADTLYHSDGTGNHAAVNGTILDLDHSSVTLRVIAQDAGSDTATFGLAAGQPLYKLANNSHLTLTGANAALVDRGADGGPAPSLAGVGLIATDSTITLGGPLMQLSGVTLTDADPQLQLTATGVTTQSSLIKMSGSPVTMSGSALKITGGSLATLGSLLDVQFTQLTVNDLSGGANKGVLDLQSFSALTLGGSAPMVRVQSATLTSNIPVLSVTGVASLTGLTGSIVDLTNSTVTLTAPLVQTTGQVQIATSAPFLTVNGGTLTVNSPDGMLKFDPTMLTASSLAQINGGVQLAGPLVTDLGGTYNITGDVVGIGGTVQAVPATTPVLMVLDGTSIHAGGNLLSISPTGQVTIGGLLQATSASLQIGASLLAVGGTLTTTGATPALLFEGTSASSGLSFVAIGSTSGIGPAPSVSLAAGLLQARDDGLAPLTLSSGGKSFLAIFNGATVHATSATPFVELLGSAANMVTLDAAANGFVLGASAAGMAAPTLYLAGPLFHARNAHVENGTPGVDAFGMFFIGDGGTLVRTDSSPAALIDLTSSTLVSSGAILSLRRSLSASSSKLDLGSSPLLRADGSSLTTTNSGGFGGFTCCDTFFVAQGAALRSAFPGALISLLNGTKVNAGSSGVAGGNFFEVSDIYLGTDAFNATKLPASVTLGGGLLYSSDSTVTALFDGLNVTRSTFMAGAGSPLFRIADTSDQTWSFGGVSPLAFGTSPPGTETFGSLVVVNAVVPATGPLGDAALTLNNRLLSVDNIGGQTTFNATGNFVVVANGATLTATGSGALIYSNHANYNVASGTAPTTASRFFFDVFGMGGASGTQPSTATLAGPLLDSNNDHFSIAAAFLITAASSGVPSGMVALRQTAGTDPFLSFKGSVVHLGFDPVSLVGVAGAGDLAQVNPNTQMSLTGPLALIDTQGQGPWLIDRFVRVRCGGTFACSGAGTAGLETSSTAALVTLNGVPMSNGVPVPHVVSHAMFDLTGFNTQVESNPIASGLTVGADAPLRTTGILFQGQNTQISVGEVLRLDTALLNAAAPVVTLLNSAMTVQGNGLDLATTAQLTAGTAQAPINAVFGLNGSTLTLVNGSLVSVANSFMSVVGNLFSLTNGSAFNILNGALVSALNHGVFQLTGGSLGLFGSGANQLHIIATPGGVLPTVLAYPNFPYPVMLLNGATASQILVAANFVPFVGLGGSNALLIDPNAALLVVNGPGALIVLGDFTQTIQLNVVNIVQNPNLHLASNETLDPQLANLAGFGNFPGGSTLVKVQNKSHATQDAGGNLLLVPAGANVTLGGLLLEVSDSTVQAGNAVVRVDGVLSASGLLRFDPAGATATTMAEVNGTVSLAGPLFTDVQGTFDISGDFLKVSGTLTTSTSSALVDFDRSAALVGQSMFDLVGVNTASDPGAGIVVGTDKPLRHAGILLQAEDASLTVGQVVRVDTALLEATAPVVQLIRSNLTVQGNALDLVNQAKLAANVPLNAVFNLNASQLTVAGSLVNVANSFMTVIGNLFSLTGGSTLNINGGALVTASGSGVFQLTGGSLGVFGTGTNALNITATPGAAGHIITTIPNLVGVPVALLNGAQATQVTVAPGFTPFSGVGSSNSVSIAPTGAALVVNGPGAKIKLGP